MSYAPQTSLIWPITQQGKAIAQQFARDHHHPAIAERVRQNTLAVWVIHEFLDALGIATDLTHSDSWNPAMQLTEDVADLVVSGVGRLECRPVPMDAGDCLVPSEALTERIGYIAVVLDEAEGEASLLGFAPDVPMTHPQLSLERLRPMDDFPTHLHQVRQGVQGVASFPLTRLSQWLEGYFETGWQAAEDLLAQYFLSPAFRQGAAAQQDSAVQVKRAKQLELGPGVAPIALVLEIEQDSDSFAMIGVRLYPLGAASLPAGLTVTILDEADTVCLTAQARSVDNYLQLYFRGHSGEPFTTQIALGDVQIEEHFII
ncbi:MAG: DUF1822 family protein [Cyanobacteria bacterium P01_C01_bin.118]